MKNLKNRPKNGLLANINKAEGVENKNVRMGYR